MSEPGPTGVGRTRLWRDGALELEDAPSLVVCRHLDAPGTLVWLDLVSPDEETLRDVAEQLGLHQLALEGMVAHRQRARAERSDGHLLVTAYDTRLDEQAGTLESHLLSALLCDRVLVTVHDRAFDAGRLTARWDAEPDLLKEGAGALLYGLLDLVVDGHFAAVEQLDDAMDDFEDQLFADVPPDRTTQVRNFQLRKSLVELRRVVLPMREVLNTLLRRDLHVLTPALVPYYQDVYDHALRAAEWTESLRDLMATISETSLSLQDHRLNTVMRQLTAWAAIIAVPTAVTGYFGQNVPYPGFGQAWGFWESLLTMLVIGSLLYVLFHRKGWL